jgi:hypothetical protein
MTFKATLYSRYISCIHILRKVRPSLVVPFRDHYETVLFWDRYESFMRPFWSRFGNVWDHFGTCLGPFRDLFRNFLKPFRNLFETFWGLFRNLFETFSRPFYDLSDTSTLFSRPSRNHLARFLKS